jgi:hypothetical protein
MHSQRSVYDAEHFHKTCARFLEALRRSIEVLEESKADTFLGRKTNEPFPMRNE